MTRRRRGLVLSLVALQAVAFGACGDGAMRASTCPRLGRVIKVESNNRVAKATWASSEAGAEPVAEQLPVEVVEHQGGWIVSTSGSEAELLVFGPPGGTSIDLAGKRLGASCHLVSGLPVWHATVPLGAVEVKVLAAGGNLVALSGRTQIDAGGDFVGTLTKPGRPG